MGSKWTLTPFSPRFPLTPFSRVRKWTIILFFEKIMKLRSRNFFIGIFMLIVGLAGVLAIINSVYYVFSIHLKYEIPWSWPSRIAADVVNDSLEKHVCSVSPLINNIDPVCWVTGSVCITLNENASSCSSEAVVNAVNSICKYDRDSGGLERLRDEIFNCRRARNRLLLILRKGETSKYIWLDGGEGGIHER